MDRSGPYRDRPLAERERRPGEHQCPACLLTFKTDVRSCPSCGTPVATVRCAECFHMNVPEAALCGGCGEQLGLEPIGEPDALCCPDCKLRLLAFSGEGGLLRDCGRCGGQFVEHPLLEALLARRELYGSAAPKPPIKHNPLDSPVRYLPCPACSDVMTRKNFGQSSGIIVDVCQKHGVWFDGGELPRVLAFVEAGGLELAREREREQARDDARRERVTAMEKKLAALSVPGGLTRMTNTRRSAEMGQAGVALLDFVRELLKER